MNELSLEEQLQIAKDYATEVSNQYQAAFQQVMNLAAEVKYWKRKAEAAAPKNGEVLPPLPAEATSNGAVAH